MKKIIAVFTWPMGVMGVIFSLSIIYWMLKTIFFG